MRGQFPLLTEKVDAQLMDVAGRVLKVVSNFPVDFNYIDVELPNHRGIRVETMPGVDRRHGRHGNGAINFGGPPDRENPRLCLRCQMGNVGTAEPHRPRPLQFRKSASVTLALLCPSAVESICPN